LFEAPDNVLEEAEIHARLVEAIGAMPVELCSKLKQALETGGRAAYLQHFMQALTAQPELSDLAPVILYRTLGSALPDGAAAAVILLPVAMRFAMQEPESLRRAGFDGTPVEQGIALFEAMLRGHSGIVFARDDYDASWARLGHQGKIQLHLAPLLEELRSLNAGPPVLTTDEFPFILMAGERRGYSANTIYRDAAWRRKDRHGALRMNPKDARSLGISNGDSVRLSTRTGSATAAVEVTPRMQTGHLSLPNGFGLDNEDGRREGVAVNELTSLEDRDPFAGTPWHKCVPARVEAIC
jgi:hypothetical protein